MSEVNVFERIREKNEISSLPQVLAEVIRISDREDVGSHELADIILRDPALTAALLRVVNSPLYSRTRKITTINQAVITLGGRAVKALALSAGLYRMFDSGQVVVERIRFWRHSLETAIFCREIGRACDFQPAEEAFVTGLMHDLGVLALEQNFTSQYREIWRRVSAGEPLTVTEKKLLGADHAEVGELLLHLWDLPPFMAEAVGAHHCEYLPGEADTVPRLTRIVNLGNWLSRFHPHDGPAVDEKMLAQIDVLSGSLGISPPMLNQLQEKVMEALPEESRFLDIRIGDMTDLLKAANALIYKQYLLVEKVLRDNRKMQEEIARNEMKKAALDSLKTITATLSHYINNASSTILGHAQLVQLAVARHKIADPENITPNSLNQIIKSVRTISLILDELKKMSSFDITRYSDDVSILDIEDRLKAQLEAMETI